MFYGNSSFPLKIGQININLKCRYFGTLFHKKNSERQEEEEQQEEILLRYRM